MSQAAQVQPVRSSTWLFGEAGGVQVWVSVGPPELRAAVMIGNGAPIVILNAGIIGTPLELEMLAWAMTKIADGRLGFTVNRV